MATQSTAPPSIHAADSTRAGRPPTRTRKSPAVSPRTGRVEANGAEFGYVTQRSAVDWSFPVTVHDVVMMDSLRGQENIERLAELFKTDSQSD